METLQVERADGVVTVTLNKPEKKNAVDPPMWTELARIWDEIARNVDQDRAVVLTGAGGDFCSGADLWLPPGEQPPHQLTAMRNVSAAIQGLHDLPQPTIAKVPGVAAGAGMSLALGCDLVVAGQSARFSEIFAKRGLAVDGGSSWLLPRMIGLHKAKELAFFADIISAAEAAEFGIVNRVVPDDELDAFVDDWAARLAAGPPIALSPDQAHAQRLDEPHAAAGARGRGPLADRHHRHQGHHGGDPRVRREARPGLRGALTTAAPGFLSDPSR